MPAAQLTLVAASGSVGAARGFVRDSLEAWSAVEVAWSAGQVVSELATNAVIHAGTPFTVSLELTPEDLRVAVRDGSRRSPRQRHYGLAATTGRGLALIDTLSLEWGVQTDAAGKTVWCRLPLAEPVDGEPDLDAFLLAEDRDDLGR